MTGPDPAEKKPTRATRGGASAEPPPPDPITTDQLTAAAAAATPAEAAVTPAKPRTTKAAAAAPAAPAPAPVPIPEAVLAPAPAPEPVAAAPTPPAPVAAAAAPALEPIAAVAAPAAPASEPVAPAGGPTPARLSTPDVAGAVDKAIDGLRTYLTVGEIVAGLGAAGILMIAWATFGVIFGGEGTWPSDVVMLLSIGLLAVLVLQNAHWHDFGPNYRLIVAGACFALGILAVLNLLAQLRNAVDGQTFDIGGLTWWAGAWVAVLGGVMVWREGR